ncbi:hypothetical protein TRIP_E160177 [uncultured Spirochaetota bacterium]|nr:hypothetical protein TRIP_E160177 [uncultured Spirochaetota bacterium]
MYARPVPNSCLKFYHCPLRKESVIVPGKIKGAGILALKPAHDVLVEFLRGMIPHFFKPLVHGGGFDDDGYIASRFYRNLQHGNLHSQNIRGELVHADPVVDLVGVPVLQLANQLNLLFIPYRAHSVQMGDIDDAQTADFHVVTDNLIGALAHQNRTIDAADLHHIVRHQAVTPLDQLQGGLALAHPRIADQEDSDAENLDQHAMNGGFRSENIRENAQHPAGEFVGIETRHQHRAAGFFGGLGKTDGRPERAGEYATGDIVGKKGFHRAVGALGVEFGQIGAFAPAENLKPIPGEGLVEARQGETRSVQVGNGYLPAQAGPPRHAGQVQGILLLELQRKQIEYGETLRLVSYHSGQCTMKGRPGKSAEPEPRILFLALDLLFFLGDFLIQFFDQRVYARIYLEGFFLQVGLQAPAEVGGDLQFVVF